MPNRSFSADRGADYLGQVAAMMAASQASHSIMLTAGE